MTPPLDMLNAIMIALSNLDWRYTTPSRIDYGGEMPEESPKQEWQERLFAYELYHKLRGIWDENHQFAEECVIHAEVRKGYQQIVGFGYMPDLLFHYPQADRNLGVVEIKLAKRQRRRLVEDFNKLLEFRSELGYKILIEILIGNEDEYANAKSIVSQSDGERVNLIHLCTKSKKPTHELIKYKYIDPDK